MDQLTRQKIENRARAIFRLSEDELLRLDSSDEMTGEAFRFAYLVLRRPRSFLEAFRDSGTLRLNPALIDDYIWRRQERIPGEAMLLLSERQLIAEHNREVEAFESRQHLAPRLIGIATT